MKMARNHWNLLPPLIVALLVGALASTAAADVRFTLNQQAILEGKPNEPNGLAAGGIEKSCDEVSLNGELGGNSRTLRLIPIYGGCIAKELHGLPTKSVYWECSYLLHSTKRMGRGEGWTASVDIACPHNHSMEWNVYESSNKYSAGTPSCVTTIPPQSEVGTAEMFNTSGRRRDIAIHWNLSGIEYSVQGSSLLCGSLPGKAQHSASYGSVTTVAAKNIVEPFPTAGHYIDFSISG